MPDSTPRLSICIPTFNADFDLKRSVDAYLPALRKRGLSFEVVIVDGGSSDGTHDYVETITAAPEIVFTRLELRALPRLSHVFSCAKGDLIICVAPAQTLIIEAVIAAMSLFDDDGSLGMIATPTREWSFMKAILPQTSNDNDRQAATHRFGRGLFREFGDFLLQSGELPEVALLRRTAIGPSGLPQSARLHETAVLLAQSLNRADIVFSTHALVEEWPLIPLAPDLAGFGRLHAVVPEGALTFEPYEAALEFLLSRAERSDQDKSAAHKRMRILVDARKKAMLQKLVDAKLWTDAHMLTERLSAFGPPPVSPEWREEIRLRSGTSADHLNAAVFGPSSTLPLAWAQRQGQT